MLKPVNRLTKTRDFNLVLKHGQWASGEFLALKWLKLANIPQFFPKRVGPEEFKKQLRLAIVVGLKVNKRAVVRNRVKRQMREVCRLLIKNGLLREGYYLMFTAKPAIAGRSYEEIRREIEGLLRRAGCLSS